MPHIEHDGDKRRQHVQPVSDSRTLGSRTSNPPNRTSTNPEIKIKSAAARSASPNLTAALFGRFHEVARWLKPKIKKGTINKNPKSR